MPYATLRFYGRFLVAEPIGSGQGSGTVTFLAPNMTTSALARRQFKEHEVLLTVPRAAVDHARTTVEPSFRAMSDARAGFAELIAWRLRGANIAVEGHSPFTLDREGGTTLVELAAPVPAIAFTRQIDPTGLTATANGLTAAAIRMNTGRGLAFALFRSPVNFVSESDADDNDPLNDRLLGIDAPLADVVEVTLEADADARVRLHVDGLNSTHGEICINTKAFGPTLSFTNLCPALAQSAVYDVEFARFYDYLRDVPEDPPIPALVPAAFFPFTCDRKAHLYYES